MMPKGTEVAVVAICVTVAASSAMQPCAGLIATANSSALPLETKFTVVDAFAPPVSTLYSDQSCLVSSAPFVYPLPTPVTVSMQNPSIPSLAETEMTLTLQPWVPALRVDVASTKLVVSMPDHSSMRSFMKLLQSPVVQVAVNVACYVFGAYAFKSADQPAELLPMMLPTCVVVHPEAEI